MIRLPIAGQFMLSWPDMDGVYSDPSIESSVYPTIAKKTDWKGMRAEGEERNSNVSVCLGSDDWRFSFHYLRSRSLRQSFS